MTITNTANRVVFQGNGATTVWPFTFIIPSVNDIVVTLVDVASGNETPLTPVQFTATGYDNPAGGSVTYPLSGSPLSAATYLVIERTLALVQDTDLVNQGGAYPADIEGALDYLTMITQQQQDLIERSIIFSAADIVVTTLPTATARANKLFGFDSSGNPIAIDGITPGTTVSAAMIPVVTAPSTNAALAALGLPGALLDLLIPAGVIWDYCLPNVSAGFALSYGQPCTGIYPVLRGALVAAGAPYGTNGVDPLLPDCRARDTTGKSNMGGIDNGLLVGGSILGAILGINFQTLTQGMLPQHTHASPTLNDPGHGHPIRVNTSGGGPDTVTQGQAGLGATLPSAINTNTTGITLSAFTGANPTGLATPFSIIEPKLIVNKIIKVH